MVEVVYFYIFSFLLLATAFMTVVAKSPITSVLFLMASFFNGAALMIMMGAEFIGMLQIIVYVGAIAVLFLFVIMMLDVSFEEIRKETKLKTKMLSLFITLSVISEFVFLYINTPSLSKNSKAENIGTVYSIGEVLYTEYAYPFQIAGMILLTAMVGAITLVFRGKSSAKKQDISKQINTKAEDVLEIKKIDIGAGVE